MGPQDCQGTLLRQAGQRAMARARDPVRKAAAGLGRVGGPRRQTGLPRRQIAGQPLIAHLPADLKAAAQPSLIRTVSQGQAHQLFSLRPRRHQFPRYNRPPARSGYAMLYRLALNGQVL